MMLLRKLVKECQSCVAYEDILVDYKFERKCERLEKPHCYTAYKEVTAMTVMAVMAVMAVM